MVTLSPGGAMRQTYFRDGEIKFSRLTPVDLEEGQTLGAITRLVRQDDASVRVEYSWHWAPSYEGGHLGIPTSAPTRGTATLRQTDQGWRVAE